MDLLEQHHETIEREVFWRTCDLLHAEVDLIFYDTTSVHCEVDEEDEGVRRGSPAAGGRPYPAARRFGYPKNRRGDVPQIVVGLAVTRDGLPVRCWIFPGNTVDVTTVEQVKTDLRGWQLGRCVFVGDAGMVSAENLQLLAAGGGRYLLGTKLRAGDEVTKHVVNRPGRYRTVKDNLRVNEVWVPGRTAGEWRRRYAVCFNPQEAERQRRHRARVLSRLEAEPAALDRGGTEHPKRACELVASQRFRPYLRQLKGGRLRLDRRAVREAARYDGKFVVTTNDDTLTAEDMALGYKQLMRVEQSWRELKSGIRLRPLFHWVPHGIHAHRAPVGLEPAPRAGRRADLPGHLAHDPGPARPAESGRFPDPPRAACAVQRAQARNSQGVESTEDQASTDHPQGDLSGPPVPSTNGLRRPMPQRASPASTYRRFPCPSRVKVG